MSTGLLEETIAAIQPLDPLWLARAQERLDQLTKPRGSLGRLEELAAWYAAGVHAHHSEKGGGHLCR